MPSKVSLTNEFGMAMTLIVDALEEFIDKRAQDGHDLVGYTCLDTATKVRPVMKK
jgi:hypothetical protein